MKNGDINDDAYFLNPENWLEIPKFAKGMPRAAQLSVGRYLNELFSNAAYFDTEKQRDLARRFASSKTLADAASTAQRYGISDAIIMDAIDRALHLDEEWWLVSDQTDKQRAHQLGKLLQLLERSCKLIQADQVAVRRHPGGLQRNAVEPTLHERLKAQKQVKQLRARLNELARLPGSKVTRVKYTAAKEDTNAIETRSVVVTSRASSRAYANANLFRPFVSEIRSVELAEPLLNPNTRRAATQARVKISVRDLAAFQHSIASQLRLEIETLRNGRRSDLSNPTRFALLALLPIFNTPAKKPQRLRAAENKLMEVLAALLAPQDGSVDRNALRVIKSRSVSRNTT
jgi:hypothetical protein